MHWQGSVGQGQQVDKIDVKPQRERRHRRVCDASRGGLVFASRTFSDFPRMFSWVIVGYTCRGKGGPTFAASFSPQLNTSIVPAITLVW